MEETLNNKEYCRSCGAPLYGKFCSECGEKKFDKKDLSFKKIFSQFIDVLTHFDSKILKSVKLLITKPGYLAKEYCSGSRVKYAKPLQLFFIINVVFFIMLSFARINTFTTPLRVHMNNLTTESWLAKPMVEHKLGKENITPEEYSKRLADYTNKFDTKVNLFSKSLIIIIVPIFAFFLHVLFINKKRLYAENFIFSLNFFSWLLLFNVLFLALLYIIGFIGKIFNFSMNDIDDTILGPLTFTAIGVYCFYGALRFYNEKRWISFLKCVTAPFLFLWSLNIYRFILFLITYYST